VPPGDFVAAASPEGELALKQFRVPPGFKVELFAAEPMLANPVAFDIDHGGRTYVVETFRHSPVGPAYRFYDGAFDVRSHMDWLEDDLAGRTVADRVAMYRRHLSGDEFNKLSRYSERVRLIEDTNRDGRADRAVVFADGFNDPADGIAAGVLARGTNVYFACIPNLWLLGDADKDGKAEVKRSLSSGYGVHIAFLGHDLHGLALGPDGRLYFSVGDRGLNVTNREGRVLFYPDEGTVLRCEPDGANLEVYHRGLRNPQELVFDELGNLFTADNNSDGGDRARWVHLVEGGDSGWRLGYQHLTAPPRRGPWNGEQLWRPQHDGQPSWIIPPLANLGYGPSGLAYHPGTGLNDRYRGHFFLCDFRGGSSSGIHTFSLKPKGASFELATYEPFIWECLPTDVTIGPDGALYFSDWVEGWNKTGKGRLYRVQDPAASGTKEMLETKRLLAEGMSARSVSQLGQLLAHADMRVRLEAQFELVERAMPKIGAPGVTVRYDNGPKNMLRDTAMRSKNRLARLHGIWGVGQLARRGRMFGVPAAYMEFLPLLQDRDPEIRARAAELLGERKLENAYSQLARLVEDASPRVRYFATMSLAKLYGPENGVQRGYAPTRSEGLRQMVTKRGWSGPVMDPEVVFSLLRRNTNRDPYIAHAARIALANFASETNLAVVNPALRPGVVLSMASRDRSSQVRMAALLAYRRLGDTAVDRFLEDDDPLLVLEAARAINDAPIDGSLASLAGLLSEPELVTRFAALDSSVAERRRKATSGVEAALSSVATETGSWTFSEQLFYRVINANFRLGQSLHASALARFAADTAVSTSLRVEALSALADWAQPSNLDRVMGLHRPLSSRPASVAIEALSPVISGLLDRASDPVRLAALAAIERLRITEAAPAVLRIVESGYRANSSPGLGAAGNSVSAEASVASVALRTLSALGSPSLADAIQLALKSEDPSLRASAGSLQAKLDPSAVLPQLAAVLDNGTTRERQQAFTTLATLNDSGADTLLARWLDRLLEGQAPKELHFDILNAGGARQASAVLQKIRQFEATRPKDNLANYRECLYGGSLEAGRKLFFEREDIGCAKCHTIDGTGGQAGPVLTGIGTRKDREYIAESIMHPNAQIAVGWENVLLTMTNDTSYAGLLTKETSDALEINSPEDGNLLFRNPRLNHDCELFPQCLRSFVKSSQRRTCEI
jgi:quinoprotein glucose dehydrogenase